jgi:beta-galactosidase
MAMKEIVFLIVLLVAITICNAQTLPEIGAQVWIEPGDSDEQIDGWFKTLAENDMKTGRLFIMWNYVEPEPGKWDFSLYDKAFDAAKKYEINIIATLTTNRRAAHRGDFYQLHATTLESTQERLDESKIYIEQVVNHWKNHPALESWMLTNEAQQSASFQPLAISRYKKWLENKYGNIQNLNKQWSTYFKGFEEIEPSEAWLQRGYWNWEPAFLDFHYFWQNHLAWWLEWIAAEVRKHDATTDIHAHTGGITGNLAELSYDLPSWSKFTNTLGASIHPSWHFGPFQREQFPMAVSFCAELMRGASQPNPYWVTELQGGQNIFSGGPYPLTPTENDLAQWTWLSVTNDADKVVYWILNNRSKGFEVNEWSMLDFKSKPNERLLTAGKIAGIIKNNQSLFAQAEKLKAGVTILISKETMTHELYSPDNSRLPRSQHGHITSVYAYYQTFLEMGIPVNIKHMHDFDWEHEQGHLAVVPHAIVITKEQADKMSTFVKNGNKLLMSGLSGMIDETSESWVQRHWPLKEVVGADFKDCRLIGDKLTIEMSKPDITLNGVNWCGELELVNAEVIGMQNGRIAATKNLFGKGEAVFVPTTLGLAAWTGSNQALSDFIRYNYKDLATELPVTFAEKQDKIIMQTLRSGKRYIVAITSGKMENVSAILKVKKGFQVSQLWGAEESYEQGVVKLKDRGTVVLVLE